MLVSLKEFTYFLISSVDVWLYDEWRSEFGDILLLQGNRSQPFISATFILIKLERLSSEIHIKTLR